MPSLPNPDRHSFWRRVLSDYRRLEEMTPEGFRPVIRVFLRNRADSLELGFARTLGIDPWVRFELTPGVSDDERTKPVAPDAQWIYVREEDVERVVLSLREAPPFDFERFEVLGEGDEPTPE